MFNWAVTFLLIASLTACAAVKEHTTAVNGALADTASTALALTKSGVVESNPMGFPLTILGKLITITYIKTNPSNLDHKSLEWLDHTAGSVWLGASVNNLAVIIGVANPLSMALGITIGTILYLNSAD